MHPPEVVDATPYGLHRPTLLDARQSVERVHGNTAMPIWAGLLERAGLSGEETGHDAIERLTQAMSGADPVTRLCGQALRIRLMTHTHLTAAHAMTRSTP